MCKSCKTFNMVDKQHPGYRIENRIWFSAQSLKIALSWQ